MGGCRPGYFLTWSRCCTEWPPAFTHHWTPPWTIFFRFGDKRRVSCISWCWRWSHYRVGPTPSLTGTPLTPRGRTARWDRWVVLGLGRAFPLHILLASDIRFVICFLAVWPRKWIFRVPIVRSMLLPVDGICKTSQTLSSQEIRSIVVASSGGTRSGYRTRKNPHSSSFER